MCTSERANKRTSLLCAYKCSVETVRAILIACRLLLVVFVVVVVVVSGFRSTNGEHPTFPYSIESSVIIYREILSDDFL